MNFEIEKLILSDILTRKAERSSALIFAAASKTETFGFFSFTFLASSAFPFSTTCARSPHRYYRTRCRSIDICIHSNNGSLGLDNLEAADRRLLLQRPENVVGVGNSSVGNNFVGGEIGRIWLGFPLMLRIRDLLPAMVFASGNFIGIGFESFVIVFHGRESFGDCLVAEKALGKKV
nr:hypothetical protein CFP56_24164 [Quercus suber]POF04615.1 hypothetical protein CFP56_39150 [Quercus suber]